MTEVRILYIIKSKMLHKFILLKQERYFQPIDYEKGALKLTLVPLRPCFHIKPLQISKIIGFMTAKHVRLTFRFFVPPK